MKIVTGHCQCKEQSPLDKEQKETLGIRGGKDCSSLLAERGEELLRLPKVTERTTSPIPQSLSLFHLQVTPPGLLYQQISRQKERGRNGKLPLG